MLPRTPADHAAAAYAATLIERTGGRWLGMWGLWSRQVWAFYCGPAEQGVCVGAADPQQLTQEMLAAEERLKNGSP